MNFVADNICAECSSPSNLETMWIMSQRFSGDDDDDDDVLARISRIHVSVGLVFGPLHLHYT